MKKVFLALVFGLTALSNAVFAEVPSLVYKGGDGTSVQIFLDPCTTTKGIFSTLEDANRPDWRRAEVTFQGKTLEACWAEGRDPSTVVLVDETGDAGPVPKALFKKPNVI